MLRVGCKESYKAMAFLHSPVHHHQTIQQHQHPSQPAFQFHQLHSLITSAVPATQQPTSHPKCSSPPSSPPPWPPLPRPPRHRLRWIVPSATSMPELRPGRSRISAGSAVVEAAASLTVSHPKHRTKASLPVLLLTQTSSHQRRHLLNRLLLQVRRQEGVVLDHVRQVRYHFSLGW